MKTSVLMSVYKKDNPKFLEEALASIYENQEVKPDEIVVVFDGQLTMELEKVLFDFRKGKENIVFYYPQKENKGLGESLRIGSEKCTGDLIFRMDADDISVSNRFKIQIEYMNNHKEIDVLGSDISEFNNEIMEEKQRKRICPKTNSEIIRMCKKRNPMNHVTICIRRKALLECGGYKSLLLLEDYYLWIRMIIAGYKFENINETLVYVRVGNGFNDKRGSKIRIKGWKVLQELMVNNKMINRFQKYLNMFYIRIFVYTPKFIKKILYNNFLRKK